jgi:hypothetical protein
MISLREIIASATNGQSDSLLEAAAVLRIDPPLSITNMARTVEEGSGEFQPLFIERYGSGDYHADQIRVLDDDPDNPPLSPDRFKTEVGNCFPRCFDGNGTDHDAALLPNIAEVPYRPDKRGRGVDTLQFRLDARMFFSPKGDWHGTGDFSRCLRPGDSIRFSRYIRRVHFDNCFRGHV